MGASLGFRRASHLFPFAPRNVSYLDKQLSRRITRGSFSQIMIVRIPMATVTEQPAAQVHETASVVIDGATWADYEAMLHIIGERRIFVNYDQGVMEVMVPSHIHEDLKDCLRLMVDILGEEAEIPMHNGGSTTHRREDLEKGVEPDECYWLREKAAAMIGVLDLDLSINPAPSLVIEVNYTHSSVSRMAIYATLGVDEIWRYDDGLIFFTLREDGTYEPINWSRQVPYLSIAEAMRQVDAYRSMGRTAWMRAFRRYAREELISAIPPQAK
jgi:Uma2 family endonuclease